MVLISNFVGLLMVSCGLLVAAIEPPLTYYKMKYRQDIEVRDKNDLFNPKVAKNVVLFLVEGLDSHTIAAARKLVDENTSGPANKMSILDSFVSGFMKTPSRDFLVADPAAATSAFFNGLPEYNGQMGWVEQQDANCTEYDPSKKMMKNLFKVMSGAGKQTGLVTLARLTSPGVAGTYASTPDMQIESDIHLKQSGCDDGTFQDIATQLIQHYKDLNVIIGAGRNYFYANNFVDPITKEKLRDSRSDMDLKLVWHFQKSLKKKTKKESIGGQNVGNALQGPENFLLGFLEERGEGAGSDLSQLVTNTISKFKTNTDAKGYFLTIYDDTLSQQHKESKAAKLGPELNRILRVVSDILDSVNKKDTLVVVASTQGSTMTLAGGSLLEESIVDFSRTEQCEPHTFMNYAFGPQQNAEYNDKTALPSYQYKSLYNNEGITGGADLPILAKGPGAHAFTGFMDMAYVYHALVYVTCLASDAETSYGHCKSAAPTTTSMPEVTTINVPKPSTTRQPMSLLVRCQQLQGQQSSNPYSSLCSFVNVLMNRPKVTSAPVRPTARPLPQPTRRPQQPRPFPYNFGRPGQFPATITSNQVNRPYPVRLPMNINQVNRRPMPLPPMQARPMSNTIQNNNVNQNLGMTALFSSFFM